MEKYTLKIRGTPTDSLSDVIQSLQLIHKSGLLTVERDGPGNTSELGRIAFFHGQVTDAEVGRLRGPEAFSNLLIWRNCCFIFEPTSTTPSSFHLSPTQQNSQVPERSHKEVPSNNSTAPRIVPYRTQHMERIVPDFQRLGLSRMHRQVFLLIDGKRTSQELARLTGRNPPEIFALLVDLERTGLTSH
jgi:Domain of unknown function (DUF4388)